jgi:hypothetical protein
MYISDKYPRFPKPEGTDGLTIRINKNKVKIFWYCYFEGDDVDEKAFKSTYRKVITKAIKKKWSGTFTVKGIEKVKVQTKIEDSSDGKSHLYAKGQKWSKISFYNKAGVSKVNSPLLIGWSRYNPGNMQLYTGDSRSGSSHRYSSANLKILAAHEFGHILGIQDGYNDKNTRNINSIMCDQWGERNGTRKVTGLDIEKALDAYNTNTAQSWN